MKEKNILQVPGIKPGPPDPKLNALPTTPRGLYNEMLDF